MKSFRNIILKGKSIYKHIVSSMFDSNNPETVVEHLLKSTETDSVSTIEEQCKHPTVYPPLYNEPSNDFYMESEKVMNKRCEEESVSRQINEKTIHSQKDFKINPNEGNELVCSLARLLEDLSQLNSQTDDENAKSTIMYCSNRICEILLSSGCIRIEGDTSFDSKYHVPSPFTIVPDGVPIEKTLEFGIIHNNMVLKKAVVLIKK